MENEIIITTGKITVNESEIPYTVTFTPDPNKLEAVVKEIAALGTEFKEWRRSYLCEGKSGRDNSDVDLINGLAIKIDMLSNDIDTLKVIGSLNLTDYEKQLEKHKKYTTNVLGCCFVLLILFIISTWWI